MRMKKKILAAATAIGIAGGALVFNAGTSNAEGWYPCWGEEDTVSKRAIWECCGGVHSTGPGAPVACRSRMRHERRYGGEGYGWDIYGIQN